MASAISALGSAKVGGVGLLVSTGGITSVFAGGSLVCGLGSAIASHGTDLHAVAVIAGGSSRVFANGVPVCANTVPATCGHTATNGLENVRIGL